MPRPARRGRPVRIDPATWAEAAIAEIEEHGVDGLSVEAVARRLGVSKGGAYHHFGDRRALLRAALDRWQLRQVTELDAEFRAIEDPATRLHAILEYALLRKRPTVILQLMAADEDPDVAAALADAADARLALLRDIFRALGATPADAEDRALIAYGHYLGLVHLGRQSPTRLATPQRARAHLRRLERLLLTGLTAAGS